MKEKLFHTLKKELKKEYGLTKNSFKLVPFQKWRTKLKNYPQEFKEEYLTNLNKLKKELKLDSLEKIKNNSSKFILFVGVPGAGKTTLAKIIKKEISNTILFRGHEIVDVLDLQGNKFRTYTNRLKKRKFSNPDPWYLSYLYQEQLARDFLNLGYNVIFDDNIRTRENRMAYFKLAKECKSKIIFIQINAPFNTYLQREEGKITKKKTEFLANFIFQGQDLTKIEKSKYSQVIYVDGTSKVRELKKILIKKLR